MGRRSTIRVDDDLAPGQAGVALRASNDEIPCRIDERAEILRAQFLWDDQRLEMRPKSGTIKSQSELRTLRKSKET